MCERSESSRRSLCLAWAYAGFAKGGALLWGLGKLRAGEAARGVTTRLLGRSGACPPPRNIFKWCNLVCSGVYFHIFFYLETILKMFIFIQNNAQK